MTKSQSVMIVGAGGFIGGGISEALYLRDRYSLRAGVGRWASAARIARFPMEIVISDMTDSDSLDAAFEGVDVVVHCARARGKHDLSLAGTKLVLERARAAGVRKLIFMSSGAVYGDATGVITESTAPVAPLSPYAIGKRLEEDACRSAASDKFKVAVLRPTLVYGPFSDTWTVPPILRLVSQKWSKLGKAGEGLASLVYIGDLVRFVEHLIETDWNDYIVFNANGGDIVTWNEYFERLNALLKLPELRAPKTAVGFDVAIRRPVRLLGKYILAKHSRLLLSMSNKNSLLKALLKKAEEDLKIKPNDDELRLFSLKADYSMERAKQFGFVPVTSLDDGLADSVEWAKAIGLVS